MSCCVLGYLQQDANLWKRRVLVIFFADSAVFLFSTLDISQSVSPKSINRTIFWKNSIWSFRSVITQALTSFLLSSPENTKYEPIFDIYMTITLAVNMIPRRMKISFKSALCSIHRYILLLHSKTFKIQLFGVPLPLHYALVCKIHIYMPKTTLSSLLTHFCLKIYYFLYITCFAPNLILVWP